MSQQNIDFIIRAREQLEGINKALAGTKKLRTEMRETTGAGRSLSRTLTNLSTGAMAGVGFAAANLAASIPSMLTAGVQLGVRWNATLEQARTGMETLLGSTEAAAQRVDELVKFATTTPFQQAEVLEANRLLQALTQGALATEEGMRLVGDAASAAGRGLGEAAMWVGRLYSGLQSGTPVGEATLRLIEMGLVTGEQQRKLNELAKTAQGSAEAMQILRDTFAGSAGAMQKQSETLNGMLTTLKDTFGALAGEAAEPFFDLLKKELRDLLIGLDAVTSRAELFLATVAKVSEQTAAGAKSLAISRGDRDSWLSKASADADRLEQFFTRAKGFQLPNQEEFRMVHGPGGTMMKTRNLAGVDQWRDFRAGVMEAFPDAFDEAEAITMQSWHEFLNGLGDAYAAQVREMNLGQMTFLSIDGDFDALNVRRIELSQQGPLTGVDARELELIEMKLRQIAEANQLWVAKLPELEEKHRNQTASLQEQVAAIDLLIAKQTESFASTDNTNLSEDAKRAQRLDYEIALNNLIAERSKLTTEIKRAENEALDAALSGFFGSLDEVSEKIGKAFDAKRLNGMTTALYGVSGQISGLVQGTRSWGQAWASMGSMAIDMLVRLGLQMIANQLLGDSLKAKDATTTVAAEATKAPLLMANAAAASIGSWGAAAVIGIAALVAGMAAFGGFAEGGYTGSGGKYQPAGVVHRGEYVFDAESTRRIGVAQLEAMRFSSTLPGYADGGAVSLRMPTLEGLARESGAAGGGTTEQNFAYFNTQRDAEQWLRSREGEKFLLDFAKRNYFRR